MSQELSIVISRIARLGEAGEGDQFVVRVILRSFARLGRSTSLDNFRHGAMHGGGSGPRGSGVSGISGLATGTRGHSVAGGNSRPATGTPQSERASSFGTSTGAALFGR